MSFLEDLRKAKASHATILQCFLRDYSTDSSRLYVFYEGAADPSFYVHCVNGLMPPAFSLELYRCGGKPNLLLLLSAITAKRDLDPRVLFLADKDMDDLVPVVRPQSPCLYETDVYSIENYLVNATVLRRVLVEILHLDKTAVDSDLILAHFEEQFSRFARRIRVVMAWILLQRRQSERPILQDVDMRVFGSISTDVVYRSIDRRKVEPRLRYLSRTTQCRNATSWKTLRPVCRDLEKRPVHSYIRGKFAAWFMVEFINRLLRSLIAEGLRLHVVTSISHCNMVEVLGPRCAPPTSLRTFLESRLSMLPSPAASE